jgi:hypothetical protein
MWIMGWHYNDLTVPQISVYIVETLANIIASAKLYTAHITQRHHLTSLYTYTYIYNFDRFHSRLYKLCIKELLFDFCSTVFCFTGRIWVFVQNSHWFIWFVSIKFSSQTSSSDCNWWSEWDRLIWETFVERKLLFLCNRQGEINIQ